MIRVVRRAVRDRRRWLTGWSIGIVALIGVTVGFWPSLRDRAAELNDMVANMPDGLASLFGISSGVQPFSPVGYLSSQIYVLMLPVLLLIAGIGVAGSLAGDEEHGLLETTYSLPITRRRVVIERWLAMVVLTSILVAVSFVAVAISVAVVDLGVGTAALVWASVGVALLTWAVAGIGLAAGALTGRRSIAITAASGIAVVSYVITSMADAGIGFFETIRPISVFSHYDVVQVLLRGRPTWALLVLVAVAAAGLAVAAWGIDRRDLRAG